MLKHNIWSIRNVTLFILVFYRALLKYFFGSSIGKNVIFSDFFHITKLQYTYFILYRENVIA